MATILVKAMNPEIKDWRGRRVWLVGASSGIGEALAKVLAQRGARLALSARSREKLEAMGLDGLVLPCDITDRTSPAKAWNVIRALWGGVDIVIYLAGDYTPMRAEDFDLHAAERMVEINALGAMRLTALVMPELLRNGGGLALVSSVAGYRGLPKALAYGPGKAALINFAESLYFDLAPRGIGVWLINPGFVATRLTAKNDFRMPALLTPEQAAQAMLSGFASGRFEIHFPRRFTWVMKGFALLPARLYFPLVRRFTGG